MYRYLVKNESSTMPKRQLPFLPADRTSAFDCDHACVVVRHDLSSPQRRRHILYRHRVDEHFHTGMTDPVRSSRTETCYTELHYLSGRCCDLLVKPVSSHRCRHSELESCQISCVRMIPPLTAASSFADEASSFASTLRPGLLLPLASAVMLSVSTSSLGSQG